MSISKAALQAAAPILIEALTDVKEAVTTILTGDPALIGARVQPAIAILDAKLVLLAPELLSAEEVVVAGAATAGIQSLIAKLQALSPPTP
jgi:hypothetical protein